MAMAVNLDPIGFVLIFKRLGIFPQSFKQLPQNHR